MKTAVRDTSIAAYDAMHASGVAVTQQNVVMAFIRLHPRCTRNEIAEGTKIRLSSVCGRVNELLESNPPRIRENGKKKCPVTGSNVYALEVMPAQGDLEFAVSW